MRGEDDIQATGAQANLGLCPNCGNSFCVLCRGTFHALSPCKSASRTQNKPLLFLQRQTGMSFEEMFGAFEGALRGAPLAHRGDQDRPAHPQLGGLCKVPPANGCCNKVM